MLSQQHSRKQYTVSKPPLTFEGAYTILRAGWHMVRYYISTQCVDNGSTYLSLFFTDKYYTADADVNQQENAFTLIYYADARKHEEQLKNS